MYQPKTENKSNQIKSLVFTSVKGLSELLLLVLVDVVVIGAFFVVFFFISRSSPLFKDIQVQVLCQIETVKWNSSRRAARA